ncbi:MAG TPA: RNA polymerase sigma factor RpoH [Candidatus Aphodousia faecigallinarum]|uniref:RNA polymerase sigma factor n=1 Tax=Candidatus Aphodousia faecigallinarum TaxID=2840677 RepID=A0A9D1LFZ6_9BURK|nr:RNA polymerase sigma factor RpoH [Candidatus Aphodousia faecigallinarum]
MADTKSKTTSTANALVPYQSKVPSVIPSLGNLDAYIQTANRFPILSYEEERNLVERLHKNNDMAAGRALVLAHLRLVIAIARSYLGYGIPHADLIQEGNIGLLKAIKHYDPTHGARLMTFAEYWIRSEIQDYIIKNWRQVKLATTKSQRKLFFNLRSMRGENALTYSQANQIAQKLDVKPSEVLEMEQRMYGNETPIDLPADSNSSDDENSSAPIQWLSSTEDEPTTILEQKDEERMQQEGIRQALASLDERSRRVIMARWLNVDDNGNNTPKTLQELAQELGVSAERVRQIEKNALIKMRKALTAPSDEYV